LAFGQSRNFFRGLLQDLGAAGLQLLESLEADPRLTDHHRFDAVKGHLLELAGDSSGAIDHYRKAAAKTGNLPERNYLLMQAAWLAGR